MDNIHGDSTTTRTVLTTLMVSARAMRLLTIGEDVQSAQFLPDICAVYRPAFVALRCLLLPDEPRLAHLGRLLADLPRLRLLQAPNCDDVFAASREHLCITGAAIHTPALALKLGAYAASANLRTLSITGGASSQAFENMQALKVFDRRLALR